MMKEPMDFPQRLARFKCSVEPLAEAIAISEQRAFTDLEQLGFIHRFELCFDLACELIEHCCHHQEPQASIQGRRDAFYCVFKHGLINDVQLWMDMIKSRQHTVHSYNKNTADEIALEVIQRYYPALMALKQQLEDKAAAYE